MQLAERAWYNILKRRVPVLQSACPSPSPSPIRDQIVVRQPFSTTYGCGYVLCMYP